MKRVTINTIKAGDKVLAGYKDFRDANEFLGFTDRSEKHGETPKFATFKEAKAAGMGKNAREYVIRERTWATSVDRYEPIYERLTSHRRAA